MKERMSAVDAAGILFYTISLFNRLPVKQSDFKNDK